MCCREAETLAEGVRTATGGGHTYAERGRELHSTNPGTSEARTDSILPVSVFASVGDSADLSADAAPRDVGIAENLARLLAGERRH